MTDKPHTPTTPDVKDPAHFRAVYVDHMDSGKYDGPTPNMSERTRGAYALQFDRMIQAVEAAAEQRGAERALREAADDLEPGVQHESPYIKAGRDIIRVLRERADRMEGDDEKR